MIKKYTSEILPYDIGRIAYTLRVKIYLKEEVEPCCLEKAVNVAMKRYPYFMKTLIRFGEEYVFADNNRPVVVYAHTGSTRALNSPEVNYHLVSVDYSGKEIGFNISHMLAGGCGIFEWLRTVLYCYLTDRYSVDLNVEELKVPGQSVEEGERDYLDPERLPDMGTIGLDRIRDGEMALGDYMAAYTDPSRARDCYYRFEFSQQDLMNLAKSSDGSPVTLLASLMFRMLYKAWPDKKLPIQAEISHNYRSEVGCPNTTCDIVRQIYVCYPDQLADAPLEKLCTITRGTVILQSQKENAVYDGRRVLDRFSAVESLPTLEEKKAYCQQNTFLAALVHNSCVVSYTGQTKWGDMLNYIEGGDIITDGHLMLEVISLGDKIGVSFQQVVKDTRYVEGFIRELENVNIPYQVSGPFDKNLAGLTLPQ